MYESKISNARWIAYDLPGNAGWIAYIVCLILLMKRGVDVFTVIAIIPALFMLIGVVELISERIAKLDFVLPRARLFRGFGALTLGGILGVTVSLGGLIVKGSGTLLWIILAGSCLCALFAWLLYHEYHPQS